ncbi:MAG: hypothetical protein JSR66_00165 [Proteobacteria bacterium]|nr:hypothetical protein [Pseudomonadota bacterium]
MDFNSNSNGSARQLGEHAQERREPLRFVDEAVLPYFRKAEDQSRGADQYHGVGGPLSVEDLRFRNPLSTGGTRMLPLS